MSVPVCQCLLRWRGRDTTSCHHGGDFSLPLPKCRCAFGVFPVLSPRVLIWLFWVWRVGRWGGIQERLGRRLFVLRPLWGQSDWEGAALRWASENELASNLLISPAERGKGLGCGYKSVAGLSSLREMAVGGGELPAP